MNLQEYMASDDAALWEEAYHKFISAGLSGIDEWLLFWLNYRIKLPVSLDYSIFKANEPLDAVLMGIRTKLSLFHLGKERILRAELYRQGDYHPYFECEKCPDSLNKRFESVGNPMIDKPNYRKWEEFLFYKLLSEILFDENCLDAFIEGIRKHH